MVTGNLQSVAGGSALFIFCSTRRSASFFHSNYFLLLPIHYHAFIHSIICLACSVHIQCKHWMKWIRKHWANTERGSVILNLAKFTEYNPLPKIPFQTDFVLVIAPF